MRSLRTSGSVGRAPGNRCLYPEPDAGEWGAVAGDRVGGPGAGEAQRSAAKRSKDRTMERVGALRLRTYGTSGPVVIVLHGGPADVGGAAPVARGLAAAFRVLEPWQRGSGGTPLTVACHIADLHELMVSRGDGTRPALVGTSWGAMLALAYAAAHPDWAGPLVLV